MKWNMADRKNDKAISTFDNVIASVELYNALDLELHISTTIFGGDKK